MNQNRTLLLPPKTTTTAQVDWLTISGKHGYRKCFEILQGATGDEPEPGKPYLAYEQRISLPTQGIDLLRGHCGDPERVLAVFPGTACQVQGESLRRTACDLLDASDGKFTRVDTAIDLRATEGHTFDAVFDELSKVAQSGSLVGSKDEFTNGLEKTIATFGSRDSSRYLRIYDKGLEQGLEGRTWLRFEAEFTHEVAHEMTEDMYRTQDWTKFAQAACRGCFPKFETQFPELAERLFDQPAYRPTVHQQIADLDNWVKAVQHQFGGRVQMLAQMSGLDPYEVARRLDLFETKPTKRLSRHSGFLACAMARLDDIMTNDDQTETSKVDQGEGRSGDPADGDQALSPEYPVAQRTSQSSSCLTERLHRQAHRFDARNPGRPKARRNL